MANVERGGAKARVGRALRPAKFFCRPGLVRGRASVAQVVAGVAAVVLLQIVLVILLGRPELGGRNDLGDEGALPFSRGLDARLYLLRDLPLLIVLIEDGRAILGPDVVP